MSAMGPFQLGPITESIPRFLEVQLRTFDSTLTVFSSGSVSLLQQDSMSLHCARSAGDAQPGSFASSVSQSYTKQDTRAFDTHPRKHNSIIPRPPLAKRVQHPSDILLARRAALHFPPSFPASTAQRKTGYLEML